MKRLSLLFVLLVMCLGLIPVAMSFARAAGKVSNTPLLPGIASGNAYGGYLKTPAGSNVASAGPLFPVGLGCALSTKNASASGAGMTLGGFTSTGSVTDTVSTTRSATAVSVNASSKVQSVSILSGLITGSVNASVSSNATSIGASSSNTTTFSSLVVAGVPIPVTPPPNTTLPLPGLGHVTLNEQVGPTNGISATSISVNAIDVSVTQSNTFGLPVGTHIIVAHADSSFTRTAILAAVGASSYGLFAEGKPGSSFATSGPWAEAGIGCTGGNDTVSNLGVTVPLIGNTGSMTDTASGKISLAGATASSSSTVQGVNILSGLISVGSVSATAQGSITSGKGSGSASATFTNGSVNGKPIATHPAPNTMIPIPNLGFVVVNEQAISTSSTKVSVQETAMELDVTTSNSLVGHLAIT